MFPQLGALVFLGEESQVFTTSGAHVVTCFTYVVGPRWRKGHMILARCSSPWAYTRTQALDRIEGCLAMLDAHCTVSTRYCRLPEPR